MARDLGQTQLTLATEHRSWEIVISLPRNGTPSLFVRRERVNLQNGTPYERRELPAITVTPSMLTSTQRTALISILADIDVRADAAEAGLE